MEIKTLQNGFGLPAIGLGTWKMGGEMSADTSNDEQCISAIKAAVSMGYTHIDTASLYGAGHAEELIKLALVESDRSALTIATKVFRTDLGHDDFITSVGDSLGRLGLDQVDLLYIHQPNEAIPLKETMIAMDEAVTRGWTKQIAVSNFSVEQMKEAQSYTKNKIVANQVQYSLSVRNEGILSQNMESEVIPYCQANDMLVVSFMPVERGALLVENPVMDQMVEKYQKTRAQVALNWVVSQDNVVTIPMSTNPEHLKENFETTDWIMDTADWQALDEEYRKIADQ